MVDQKLPHFIFSFLCFLLFGSLQFTCASTGIKYCMYGTEDDVTGLKNMSCRTGEATQGNMLSLKRSENSDPMSDDTNYHCMAFAYNVSSTVGDKTVTMLHINYTCDTENNCLGRKEPFEQHINGMKGQLYCCATGNNCNTEDLTHAHIHSQKCYTGQQNSVWLKACPSNDMQCIKIITSTVEEGNSRGKVMDEEYRCDRTEVRVCNNSLDESCTLHTNHDSGLEVKTCCCKDSECNHPSQRSPPTDTVVHQPGTSSMQKTLVIVIGIALGILVVAVTLFFIRRSLIRSSRKEGKSRYYSATVFRAISKSDSEAVEDDKVQILTT